MYGEPAQEDQLKITLGDKLFISKAIKQKICIPKPNQQTSFTHEQ